MTRVTWGVVAIFLGLAIAGVGIFAHRLPVPDKFDVTFRALGAPSFDTSIILALAGVIAVLASLIALSGGFRGIMVLRYVGVVAFFAGIFVEKFRVPANIDLHLTQIDPVPFSLSAGLIVVGGAFFTLGMFNLVKAASVEGSPRLRHR